MTSVKPTISTPTPARTKIILAFGGRRRTTAATTIIHPASSSRNPASFMHPSSFAWAKTARPSVSAISHNLIISAIKVCDVVGGVTGIIGKSRSLARSRTRATSFLRASATRAGARRDPLARDDNRGACGVAERCGTDPHATTACGAPAKAGAGCRLEALRGSGQAGATKKEKQIPRKGFRGRQQRASRCGAREDNERKNPQPLHLIFSAQAPLALGRKGWATSWARRLRNDSG